MPTARRALIAAGLFAAVTGPTVPALATPGAHGHGAAVRPALVIPSANAAEHAHAHTPAKIHATYPSHPAHPSRPAHRSHAAHIGHGRTSTASVTTAAAAATATGSSGRTRHVRIDRKTEAARVGAASTTAHGKHQAKGGAKHTQPAKTAPNAGKPATPKPGQGTVPIAGRPAPVSGKTAATSQSRATFGDTTPLSLGRPAAAAPATTRPARHATPAPKSRTGSTSTNAGPTVPVVPVIGPPQFFGPLGRAVTNLTGIGLFSGPQGWIFTAMLVMAVIMMAGAFALGRRPRSAG